MAKPEIVAYIEREREVFTDAAIRAGLEKSGYGPADIDEGFAAARPASARRGDWSDTLGKSQFWLAYVGSIIGSLTLLWVLGNAPGIGGNVVPAAIALAVLLAIASRLDRLDLATRRGAGAALTTMVVVPIVVIGGIWAWCLVTQPRFVVLGSPWA